MHVFDVRGCVLNVFRNEVCSPFFLESSHKDEEVNPEGNVGSEDPCGQASLVRVMLKLPLPRPLPLENSRFLILLVLVWLVRVEMKYLVPYW
jgi:hypothetical protein